MHGAELAGQQQSANVRTHERLSLPDANEVDADIQAEGFLERPALIPSIFVRARVHLVREWDLLMVVQGQESDLVQHAGEGACGICTAREPEQADLFPWLVCR